MDKYTIIPIIISVVSLLVAIISLCSSLHAQKIQNKINKHQLDMLEKESTKESCVEARTVSYNSKRHIIKIWNSGNDIAININILIDNNNIILNDTEKLPFEFLEPNKSFDLSFFPYDNCPRKFKITTKWENNSGKKMSKEQFVTW